MNVSQIMYVCMEVCMYELCTYENMPVFRCIFVYECIYVCVYVLCMYHLYMYECVYYVSI